QHVDERRLACAVRPDDGDELARADAEAHPIERAEFAIVLREVTRFDDHDLTALIARDGSRRGPRANSPMSPPGAKSTMKPRIAPKMSLQDGTTDITVSCR